MDSIRSLLPPSMLRGVLCAATVVAALGTAQPAQATVLQVAPVRLQFEPKQQGQEIQVSNNGTEVVEAQVRVMRWTQESGQDRLTAAPSEEIVASPPIMRIEPGHKQTVRVIRLNAAAPASELSYRLLIDELPHHDQPHGSGIAVLMRYSIPVFVGTVASAPAAARHRNAKPQKTDLSQVRAQVVAGSDGKAQLRVDNGGSHFVRISALSAETPGGQAQDINRGLVGYVLAGQQMTWPLNLAYPLSPGLALKARFNDDTEVQAVPLDVGGR